MSRFLFRHSRIAQVASLALALVLGSACGGDDASEASDAGDGFDAAIVDAGLPDAVPPDAEVDASIFPVTLEETGLYADFAAETLAPGVIEFTPAWPLWTDGALKRRWVLLPEGTSIDTADMDFWVLPEGTKLWKEFSAPGGQRIETRFLWKMGPNSADWYYMSFAWDMDTTEAVAVPDGVVDALGTTFDIPRERDCRTCHERMPDFALGFGAVQLAHTNAGVTLDTLIADARLTVNPEGTSPYFPVPGTGDEQEVIGYLHGNCGGCHHPTSDVQDTTDLNLRLEVASMATPEETAAYSTIVGLEPLIKVGPKSCSNEAACVLDGECVGIGDELCLNRQLLIEPGDIDDSVLYTRAEARGNNLMMPPKGTEIVDQDFLDELERWINGLPVL